MIALTLGFLLCFMRKSCQSHLVVLGMVSLEDPTPEVQITRSLRQVHHPGEDVVHDVDWRPPETELFIREMDHEVHVPVKG